MSLAKQISQIADPTTPAGKPRKGLLWKGPEEDGITFSLLSRFLVDRERFRVHVCEGLKAREGFNHRMEYGNMWHICEEHVDRGDDPGGNPYWYTELCKYEDTLALKFPISRENITHWANVCATQFNTYIKHREKVGDTKGHKVLLPETCFRVPHKLPSGRVVTLRGKWDLVDYMHPLVYIQENKTKGNIDEKLILSWLRSGFDLQTMLYMTSLYEGRYISPLVDVLPKGCVLQGVRYNVIRRPLSGGKGTIVRHKATKNNPEETFNNFYNRLGEYFSNEPEYFFMRWEMGVMEWEVERFKKQCLDPILEQLWDWWEWINDKEAVGDPFRPFSVNKTERNYGVHFRYPYGVWNPLLGEYSTYLDDYLETGSELGLERVDNLFPELIS